MNEIVNNCNNLEKSTSIKSNTVQNINIHTNVGYLISSSYETIIDICKTTFSKTTFKKSINRDTIKSYINDIDNINIIITQSYLLLYWEKYMKKDMIIINNDSKLNNHTLTKYKIIIIPHHLFTKHFNIIQSYSFKRILYHNYYNKNIRHYNITYDFKWFIFSSIKKLNNCSIVDDSIICIDRQRKKYDIEYITIQCKRPLEIMTLKGLVDETLLNNIRSGNISYIIKHLSDNSIKTEKDVIRNVVRKFEEKIKNYEILELRTEQMYFANDNDKKNRLKYISDIKKEFEIKKTELRKRITDNNLCFICYSDIELKCVLRCCSNNICFHCINKWLQLSNLCPLCKKEDFNYYIIENYSYDKAIEINIDSLNANNSIFQNFILLIDNLMKQTENNKILIIASDNLFIRRFQQILLTKQLSFVNFKGNIKTLKSVLYQLESNVNIMFVNELKIEGGLILDNITDIISLSNNISEHDLIFSSKNIKRIWNFNL